MPRAHRPGVLASGVTYSYRVRARKDLDFSPYSNLATVTLGQCHHVVPRRTSATLGCRLGRCRPRDLCRSRAWLRLRRVGNADGHFTSFTSNATATPRRSASLAMDNTNDWAKAGVDDSRLGPPPTRPMPSFYLTPAGAHTPRPAPGLGREHQRRRPVVGRRRPTGCASPARGTPLLHRSRRRRQCERRRDYTITMGADVLVGFAVTAHDKHAAQHPRVRRAIYPLTATLAVRYRVSDPPPWTPRVSRCAPFPATCQCCY